MATSLKYRVCQPGSEDHIPEQDGQQQPETVQQA